MCLLYLYDTKKNVQIRPCQYYFLNFFTAVVFVDNVNLVSEWFDHAEIAGKTSQDWRVDGCTATWMAKAFANCLFSIGFQIFQNI